MGISVDRVSQRVEGRWQELGGEERWLRVWSPFPISHVYLLISIFSFLLPTVDLLPSTLFVAQAPSTERVIITLDVPFVAEGDLSAEEVARQRAEISRQQAALLRRMGSQVVRVIHRYRVSPMLALEVESGALTRLRSAREVSAIQPDVLEQPALVDSVPLLGAEVAHQLGYTGEGWSVAVLDTGVDPAHEFLQGKIVSEACYSSAGGSFCPNGEDVQIGTGAAINCPTTLARCEHGTHVAGIAVGRGDAFSGVAPDGTLIALQVFSLSGGQVASAVSDQIAALERVYELRTEFNIAAVNISIQGGTSAEPCDDISRRPIIDTLTSVGIAVVVAAGNNSRLDRLAEPACVSTAVSVGSIDKNGQVADTSNSASFLDFVAPGVAITSSIPSNLYGQLSGTSFAAPHVAGAWAVLKSKAGGGSVAQAKSALISTGLPLTDTRNGLVKPLPRLDQALLADLTVRHTVSDPQPMLGQRIIYTVSVTNSGALEVSDVSLVFEGGSGVTFREASLSGIAGSLTQTTQIVTVSAVSLATGQSFVVTIPADVGTNLPFVALPSRVSVVGAEMIAPVTATTVISTPSSPSFALSADSLPSPVRVGQTVTLTTRLTNTGNVTLTDLVADDSLIGTTPLSPPTIGLNQSATSAVSYTVTLADLVGQLESTITATARAVSGQVVTGTVQRPSTAVWRVRYLPIIRHGTSQP